jgi:hypothetical protein
MQLNPVLNNMRMIIIYRTEPNLLKPLLCILDNQNSVLDLENVMAAIAFFFSVPPCKFWEITFKHITTTSLFILRPLLSSYLLSEKVNLSLFLVN